MNQSIWMLWSSTGLPRFPIVNQMIQIRYNFQYKFQMQLSGTTGHNLVPQLGSTVRFHKFKWFQMCFKNWQIFSTSLCYNSRDLTKIGKFFHVSKIGKFFQLVSETTRETWSKIGKFFQQYQINVKFSIKYQSRLVRSVPQSNDNQTVIKRLSNVFRNWKANQLLDTHTCPVFSAISNNFQKLTNLCFQNLRKFLPKPTKLINPSEESSGLNSNSKNQMSDP